MTQKTEAEIEVLSPLFNYPEAGDYLRKSAGFVRAEVYAGRLTITRIGRTPYITKAELDRYITEQVETGEAAQRPGMTPARFRKRSGHTSVGSKRGPAKATTRRVGK